MVFSYRRMSVGFASPNFGAHIRYLLGYGFWLVSGRLVLTDKFEFAHLSIVASQPELDYPSFGTAIF